MNKNNFLEGGGKFLLFLPLFLFFISLVSAQVDTNDVDDTYQINSLVQYSKPCIYNGTYCSGTASCNFTAKDPSGDIRFNNSLGTNQGSFHNHSINFDELGIWTVDITCCDGSARGCGIETSYVDINGSGFNDNLGFYVIILLISCALMGVGFWKRDAPITILGTFGLYFLGIYILMNGIVGIRDVIYTRGIGIITLGVAFYISARASWELITD